MALARLRNTDVVEVVSLVIEELVEGELLQIKVGSGSGMGYTQQELMQLYLKKNYLKTYSWAASFANNTSWSGLIQRVSAEGHYWLMPRVQVRC